MVTRIRSLFSKIKIKILIFGLIMSIVPFLLLGTLTLYISKDKLIEEVDAFNRMYIENVVNQLESYFSSTFDAVYILRDAISSEHLDEDDYFFLFSSFMKNVSYIEGVVKFDNDGVESYRIDRWRLHTAQDLNTVQDEDLLATVQKGEHYVGPVYLNEEGKMNIQIAIPMYDRLSVSGGIAVQINLNQMLDVLLTQSQMSKDSVLYIFNDSLNLVVEPIPLSGSTMLIELPDSSNLKNVITSVGAADGMTLIVQQNYVNDDGVDERAYLKRVPTTDWIFVIEQPTQIVLSSYYQLGSNLVLATVITALIVTLTSIIFAVRFSKPIESIEGTVRKFTDGDLTSRIQSKARDEIGRLANTFNEMADALEKKTKELIEEKKRLDIVVSGLGMGLILIDSNFQVQWVNRRISEWLSDSIELIGVGCDPTQCGNQIPCPYCTTRAKQMIEHQQEEMTSQYRDRTGKLRYFRHQIFHLHEGPQHTYLEVVEDITDKREMEAAVIQADKLAAIGLLASGVAHEINNPLGILALYSEDLRDRLQEEEFATLISNGEVDKYLNTIQNQIDRCKAITTNLLNFAHMSSMKKETVELHQCIAEVLGLISHVIRKSNVEVQLHFEKSPLYIYAARGEVQQVLLNVLTNALYAMNENGNIEITTKWTDEQMALVEIEDNGTGIAETDLAKVFDPFFTTKPVGEGTGLGLSVCYGILKRLDGDIHIESKLGLGTTVKIRIPLVEGEDNER